MVLSDLSIFTIAADLICPEHCAGCDAFVDQRALFCATCRASVRTLGPPECARCGDPLPPAGRCACLLAASPIRMARAFAAYDRAAATNPVARAIARYKYAGARRLGRRLAAALLPRIPDPAVDVVVPVPLHPRRLRGRGYNQSAVLARLVGRFLGCRVELRAVTRVRHTPTQVGLGTEERARNVADAFAVRDATAVADRTVLVVDDVWTSGATARAVATTLRAAGAVAVDVATIARVL